jgi:hypothetical protein
MRRTWETRPAIKIIATKSSTEPADILLMFLLLILFFSGIKITKSKKMVFCGNL